MRNWAVVRGALCWLAVCACLPAQQYVFRPYRQAEGLKNLNVNGLVADRSGFFWLATQNGLYRSLGAGFQRFGPDEGIDGLNIASIAVDSNNIVWAAADRNVYRWDGRRFVPAADKPIHVTAWHQMAVEDGHSLLILEKHHLYRLVHDGAGKALSYGPAFSDGMLAAYPCLGRITSLNIVNDPEQGTELWLGSGKELYSWLDRERDGPAAADSGNLTEWGRKRGLEEDNWFGILLDRAGTLWAGGRYRVAVLTRGSGRFVDRSIPGSTRGSEYPRSPLVEDREGRVLAPAEDGIARWNGARWQIVGRGNGLGLMTHVAGMAFDAAGDLWLGTQGDGLYQWTGYEDWEGWSQWQGLPSSVVWTILPAKDKRMFVGTDKGPAWIDPRSGSSGKLFSAPRWNFGPADALGFSRDGSLWAGTFSAAVLHLDAKTGETRQTAKLPAFINRTVTDSSGRVFFATDAGLYASGAGEPSVVPRRVEGADAILKGSAQVDAGCRSPNGDLWFLSNNRVLRFRDEKWSQPPIDGMAASLRGTLLDISCAPDGAVWVTGRLSGTWRLTPGGERMEGWQLRLPEEMRALAPLAVLADKRGWVWLGTDLGLLVWNGRNWRHLTQESGLIWNDTNVGALIEGDDGSLWIGTSGGVAHLMHPEHVFESLPLIAVATSVGRGGEVYPADAGLKLPWSTQPLQFEISSPSARNRSELVFKYRLDGLQASWVDDEDGHISLSNIPPGAYTFMAMVYNPGQSAYSNVVRVKVRILPPWWNTWWFYSLCSVGSGLLVAGAVVLFGRHLRQRSRELERLVSERTRELEISREQLRIQATHDGLTGMLNRVAVLRALAVEMDRARREKANLLVVLVDLDHFKRLNDSFGHLAGDEALRWFASAVGNALRSYDHAGRYGGEEFLLVLTEIPAHLVEQRLASLHASISNLKVPFQGSHIPLNCCLGATLFDPSEAGVGEECLLSVADEALYEAKALGRNRSVFKKAVLSQCEDQEDAHHFDPVI